MSKLREKDECLASDVLLERDVLQYLQDQVKKANPNATNEELKRVEIKLTQSHVDSARNRNVGPAWTVLSVLIRRMIRVPYGHDDVWDKQIEQLHEHLQAYVDNVDEREDSPERLLIFIEGRVKRYAPEYFRKNVSSIVCAPRLKRKKGETAEQRDKRDAWRQGVLNSTLPLTMPTDQIARESKISLSDVVEVANELLESMTPQEAVSLCVHFGIAIDEIQKQFNMSRSTIYNHARQHRNTIRKQIANRLGIAYTADNEKGSRRRVRRRRTSRNLPLPQIVLRNGRLYAGAAPSDYESHFGKAS